MVLVAVITEDGELDVFELAKNVDSESWLESHYNKNSCNWQEIKKMTMHFSVKVK